MSSAFALISAAPLLHNQHVRLPLLVVAAVFLGFVLMAPHLLAPVNRAWHRLGKLISHFTSPIVMAALFFGVITPFGLLMRLTGKDTLGLRPAPSLDSYWVPRDPVDRLSPDRLF